uniref:Uncharacterized protein n=1 Tax=viral metagenome TaxID=1070528 RepID=A0A6M3KGG7_9ZZZZ
MSILAAIPAIAGVIGAIGSLTGGGRTYEGTATKEPAPYEADFTKIWNEYVDTFFGAEDRPGRGDVIKTDELAQRTASTQYLGSTAASVNEVLNTIQGLKSKYLSAPMSATMGGQTMQFVPGASRRTASDLLDTAMKGYQLKEAQAGRELTHGLEFTPYRAATQYYKELEPLAWKVQGLRYGLPQESGQYEIPMATSFLSAMKSMQPALDWLQKNTAPTTATTTAAYPNAPSFM